MKHNCTRDAHYILHSVCACFCIFLLLLLSVYFSFFQCSWFSVSSSFFFRCSIFFFWPFILLILLLICLKPHSFLFFFFFYRNQPSIHTKWYVRHVWDIYWTNFTSLLLGSLLLCYFVENSESAGRKTALKCGLIWALSTRNGREKKRFQNCPDSCGHGLLALFTRREGNLGVRRITLALAHFVFFTRRVYKAGSGYPSAFRHARGHLRVSRLVCYRLVKLLPFQNKRENYLGISFLEKLIQ